jgi:poly(A) polymerase
MRRLQGKWLTNKATQKVFSLLLDGGFQAFAVGGCVRNELMGHPVNDVDFATDARPERVMDLAKKTGLKAVRTGLEHGTLTLVSGGTGFEVTTFRKDIETDGRHATIAFADDIETDAHRRDFTMNALYADHEGQIFDPLGGLDDLLNGHVRFIDRPRDRIREDYLRILRFFRFHAWFGDPAGGIDAEALAACAMQADGLDGLSKERIGMEIRKLLTAPDPAPSVASMDQTGILARVLPGAASASLAVLVHHENTFGIAPSWLRRLACLGGEGQTERLRLSRTEAKTLTLYAAKIGASQGLPELAYRHGQSAALDLALLRATLLETLIPNDVVALTAYAAAQKFPVRAADITTGEAGPALGALLKHLEDRWIASQFTLDSRALLGNL